MVAYFILLFGTTTFTILIQYIIQTAQKLLKFNSQSKLKFQKNIDISLSVSIVTLTKILFNLSKHFTVTC